jgi:hypothetical protein
MSRPTTGNKHYLESDVRATSTETTPLPPGYSVSSHLFFDHWFLRGYHKRMMFFKSPARIDEYLGISLLVVIKCIS